jgi:glycosyltransferase involved in cell wall biosynthesis
VARIALLLPNLLAGGTERVTLTLAAEFVASGDEVDLVILQAHGPLLNAVPPGVRLIVLGAARLRHAVRPLRAYLERDRPDALLAQMWPLSSIAVWAARHSATRVVVVEHVQLSAYARTWPFTARALLRPVIRWSHARAAERIGVSRGVAADLAGLCALPAGAVRAIHNPVALPATAASATSPDWGPARGRRILSVGTLKRQKNQRLLIQAFALMCGPDDKLAIVGEGAERDELERTAQALGIAKQVLLPGFAADPSGWYASADLFVLSSDYEGFANVVAEALGHGLTVVSTDCPSGPAEILESVGRLAPVGDVDGLTEAMREALAHPDDPATARARAAAFAPAGIARKYRQLLLGHVS